MNADRAEIWTIGHSTRSADEFTELLTLNKIAALADVRRFPGSRKYPQFNADNLAAELGRRDIELVPMPQLGGRRKPNPGSHNTVWRNPSFRAYADYMETGEFEVAAEHLIAVAMKRRTAIMCSEAVWWRCHRSMISDYLTARGLTVNHILSRTKTEVHTGTKAATIANGKVSYGSG